MIAHHAPAVKDLEQELISETEALFMGQSGGPRHLKRMMDRSTDMTKQINEDVELILHMQKFNFDLAIVDGVFFVRSLYLIPYRLSIPFITLNAVDDPWAAGLPVLPSVQPTQLAARSNDMSFIERVQNTMSFIIIQLLPALFLPNSIIQEYAPEKPAVTFAELYKQSKLHLVNLDSICFDYPRMSAPHYQFIAGAGNIEANPLPPELKTFVDEAKEGVILVSFGSIAAYSKMPHANLKVFVDAFAQVPQRVIMKYDGEPYPNVPANVKMLGWLPQNDILGHHNTKLFITHGGNNGQLEGLFHAVPMLTIPLVGDQIYNAERIVARGFGLKTSFTEMTSESLVKDMNTIIQNPSVYEKNIKKCSEMIKTFPKPQETIVFWVNHILKFGGDHLRSPSVDLNFVQLFMIDVFLFYVAIIAFLLYVTGKLFFMCCNTSKPKQKRD